ncbi:hypothetical protein R6Q59_004320 [Mikania micrantha]
MATLQSPRYITHFTSLKTHPTASYWRTLPSSFLHLRIRRPMASSTGAEDAPAAVNSEPASDVLVTLEVKGEMQLKNLSEKLTSNNIAHKLWIEQPENYPTCLASKPYPKSVVSAFFKKLKLCK